MFLRDHGWISRKNIWVFVVPMTADPCPVVFGTSDHTTGGAKLVALCKCTFAPAVQLNVNEFPPMIPAAMLPKLVGALVAEVI